MGISKRMKWARERAGLTIGQAAKLCGIDKSRIEDLEQSHQPLGMHFEKIFTLAEKYGVTYEWIMRGTQQDEFESFLNENYGWLLEASAKNGKVEEFMQLFEPGKWI